jgi:hypothetical protein
MTALQCGHEETKDYYAQQFKPSISLHYGLLPVFLLNSSLLFDHCAINILASFGKKSTLSTVRVYQNPSFCN